MEKHTEAKEAIRREFDRNQKLAALRSDPKWVEYITCSRLVTQGVLDLLPKKEAFSAQ
jgi:hypothetical protein